MKDAALLKQFVPEFTHLSISDVHARLGSAWEWTVDALSESAMRQLRADAEARGFSVEAMSVGAARPRLKLPRPGSGTVGYCVRFAPAFLEQGHILATFGPAGGAVSIARETEVPETFEVPSERARRFLEEVAALDPLGIPDGATTVIVDGLLLECLVQEDRGNHRFFACSPRPDNDPRQYGFVAALTRLAMGAARESRTGTYLERVFGRLGRRLPVKVFEETPRRIRLFGLLTSSDAAALEALFASVAPEEAVVMDLSNLDAMGTALHPLFARFHARPGRTAWWGGRTAARHLVAAGIPRDCLHGDMESARAALGSGTVPRPS
ncbi:hypothetical protein JY651_02755 [Pyxidicoccus parkwayensis]|uniref:STAS domain-containing protein n=1 Tax=Pyxidicoccus parkwayensis TaxID=2813578 RepID=A0ABX7NYE4_9BACT|nr:hypothetical protein [Pyxidicoccus parkwaysis]QSQ23922.1 hypothetical protein JY651_02755 [Pyxidicoccus parkwaysis]